MSSDQGAEKPEPRAVPEWGIARPERRSSPIGELARSGTLIFMVGALMFGIALGRYLNSLTSGYASPDNVALFCTILGGFITLVAVLMILVAVVAKGVQLGIREREI